MLDLKKLEAKFDNLFENENEQSFNKWLHNKVQIEVRAFLGKGEIQSLRAPENEGILLSKPLVICSGKKPENFGNTQYAMAA